jgi:hypothetical protein
MKVDTQPFQNINMVEGYDRSTRHQLDFTFGTNMAGHASCQHTRHAPKRRKRLHHRRTGQACQKSTAGFFSSPEKIPVSVSTASPTRD